MKKKFLSILLLFAIVFSGCGFWGIRGDGRVREESRKVEEFNKLDAGGAFTIKVNVGKAPSLRISAEGNLLQFIRTSVKGNTLHIDTRRNISPRKEIMIEISTPNLKSVDVSGANNIIVDGIFGDNFSVELSGAGNIELSGEVGKFDADLSGAGNIEAKDLISEEVKISVSGAASADVYAKEYLDASVSGVGSIDYYGNPKKIRTKISGVGSINRK